MSLPTHIKEREMKTDNELIAEFMGYKSVRIGYLGTDDETAWQVENTDWLNRLEIREQYHDSVGDYFVNIERNEIIDKDDVDYKNDWNALMPVVSKVFSMWETNIPSEEYLRVTMLPIYTDIQVVYRRIVEFIKWYNEKK